MFNYQGNSQIVYKRNIFIVCSSKRNRLSFIAFFLGGGGEEFFYTQLMLLLSSDFVMNTL